MKCLLGDLRLRALEAAVHALGGSIEQKVVRGSESTRHGSCSSRVCPLQPRQALESFDLGALDTDVHSIRSEAKIFETSFAFAFSFAMVLALALVQATIRHKKTLYRIGTLDDVLITEEAM